MQIFLALGANLGDCRKTFCAVIEELERHSIAVEAVSRFFKNPALLSENSPAQPDYLNAVVKCQTWLEPVQLLQLVLQIERKFGRDRSAAQRWQPRTLDIDILSYGELSLQQVDLALPHPEMHKRRFVLEPLCELAPEWRHPRLGNTASELLAQFLC